MFVSVTLIAAAFTAVAPTQANTSPFVKCTTTMAEAGTLTKRQRSAREAHYNVLVRRGVAAPKARAIVTKKYGGG